MQGRPHAEPLMQGRPHAGPLDAGTVVRGRGPVAHRVHTLTPGVVTCASGTQFGRPRVKRRNWSDRKRSHFRLCDARRGPIFAALPSCVARLAYRASGFPRFQPSAGLISAVCSAATTVSRYRCPVSVRLSTLSARISSFPAQKRAEFAILHRKRRCANQLRASEATRGAAPVRGVLDRTGHRPFSTGRSAPAVQHRPFSTGRSAPAVRHWPSCPANQRLTPRRLPRPMGPPDVSGVDVRSISEECAGGHARPTRFGRRHRRVPGTGGQ